MRWTKRPPRWASTPARRPPTPWRWSRSSPPPTPIPAGDLAALEALVLLVRALLARRRRRSAGRAFPRRHRRRPPLGRRAGDAGRSPGPAGAPGHPGPRRRRRLGRARPGRWPGAARTARVAPPDAEPALLAPLPITGLRLEPETAPSSCGSASPASASSPPCRATSSPAASGRRRSPASTRRWRAPRRRSASSRPPTPWFARLAFAEPISAPEDLARVSRDIADRLCARLTAEGRAARPLRARLPPAGRPRRAARRRPVAARPRRRRRSPGSSRRCWRPSTPASGSRW